MSRDAEDTTSPNHEPKTVYYAAQTLDGWIAKADDSLDWLIGFRGSYAGSEAEPMGESYSRFYERVGAVVMGSAT